MALEESRPVPVARAPAAPRATALRGTPSVTLARVSERWAPTLSRDGVADARFEAAVRRVVDGDRLAGVDEAWLDFVARELQVCAICSQAIHDVLAAAAGRCEWGPLSRHLADEAAMHSREAQAMVLYAMDLERARGPIPLEAARARWDGSTVWEPTRRALAALALRTDWGEILVTVNLCLEPLVAQVFRREWGVRLAAAHGDEVSPVLARPTQTQQAWVRDWTRAVLSELLARPDHGPANRAAIEGWLTAWAPRAHAASVGLTDAMRMLPGDDGGALARAVADHEERLAELDLGARSVLA